MEPIYNNTFQNSSPIYASEKAIIKSDDLYPSTEEITFQETLNTLREQGKSIPAKLRLEVFSSSIKSHSDHQELVRSKIIRMMFEFDLEFMQKTVKAWPNKTKEAEEALEKIQIFMGMQTLPDEISFQEHASLCYRLSALISGVSINDLEGEYNRQFQTMVTGVVHPTGEWTPKTELENQDYAKYIFHISETGLAPVAMLNHMTAFRLNHESKFLSLRLVAVPCGEKVGFDGIEDCGSVNVLRHDFIHAGFLKYAFQNNPIQYWQGLEKVGLIGEHYRSDPVLKENSKLKKQVEGAFFMWTHELTTSIFVDGWPRCIPNERWYLGGLNCSAPQFFLRIGAKINMIPEIFSDEIMLEGLLLKSLGLKIEWLEDETVSKHEKIKNLMTLLDPGYKYLHENFHEMYGQRSRRSVIANRIQSFVGDFL